MAEERGTDEAREAAREADEAERNTGRVYTVHINKITCEFI